MKSIFFLLVALFAINTQAQSTCSPCQTIIELVDSLLDVQSTEAEILAALEPICMLPGFSSVCPTIEAQLNTVIDLLNLGQTVEQICSTLGLCSSKRDTIIERQAGCSSCTSLIGIISNLVHNGGSLTTITNLLDILCALPTFAPICSAINSNGGLTNIINMINAGLTPQQICQQLGLCSSSRDSSNSIIERQSGSGCSSCISLVGTISTLVNNGLPVSTITGVLDILCALPGFATVCNAINAVGLNNIINMINSGLTPQQICQQLGLCTSSRDSSNSIIERQSGSGCTSCTSLVGTIETLVNNGLPVGTIANLLNILCALPGFATICNEINAVGLNNIINMINSGLTPQQICQELGLCSSSRDSNAIIERQSGCSSCTSLIGIISNLVNSGASLTTITNLFNALCALPTFAPICSAINSAGGLTSIINMINAGLTPQQICHQLGLC